ncbi:MAG: lytic transglycosylase domain-containing protein, partial [Acidobacteriota bacterium]
FEVPKNLDAGARYLRWLADRFEDDLPRVLAGYNAGEGAVDRYDGVPPYRETQRYVEKITTALGWRPAADAVAGGQAPGG